MQAHPLFGQSWNRGGLFTNNMVHQMGFIPYKKMEFSHTALKLLNLRHFVENIF